MIKGSCLCGGVRFGIDEARSLIHCHLQELSQTGVAFASYVNVASDKFRLVSGEHLIQRFESAPGSFSKPLPHLQPDSARNGSLP